MRGGKEECFHWRLPGLIPQRNEEAGNVPFSLSFSWLRIAPGLLTASTVPAWAEPAKKGPREKDPENLLHPSHSSG